MKKIIIDYLVNCNLTDEDVQIVSAMIEMLMIQERINNQKEFNERLTKTIQSL